MEDKNYIRAIAKRIQDKLDPSMLPDSGIDDLFNAYAVLALTKGSAVTNEDVHDAWSAWATKHDPDNESLVPYDDLPENVKREDTRFAVAIRDVKLSEDN